MNSCIPYIWNLIDYLRYGLNAECAWLLSRTSVPTAFHLFSYLKIFTGNLLLELPFYFLALYRFLSWKKILAVLLLGNLLTHPLAYFGLPYLMSELSVSYGIMLAYAEVMAVLVEIIFCNWIVRQANQKLSYYSLGLILLANLFSWNFGVYLFV